MSRVVAVQLSGSADNLWAVDGELVEGVRMPYPWPVDHDGFVQNQDFWRGDPYRVLGFTSDVDARRIDLRWEDAWPDPQQAVGMYIVTTTSDGTFSTWQVAVQSMTVYGDDYTGESISDTS